MHRLTVIAALATACTAQARDDFEAARDRWATHGAAAYEYDWKATCFPCSPQVMHVVVVDGAIASATDVEDGSASGSTELVTIDGAFALLDEELDHDHDVRAIYDRQLGYPRSIFIDTGDDEMKLEIFDVVLTP